MSECFKKANITLVTDILSQKPSHLANVDPFLLIYRIFYRLFFYSYFLGPDTLSMEHCPFPVLKKSKCMNIVVILYFNSTFCSCIDYLHEDYFNIMPGKGHVAPQENKINQI